MYKDVDGNIYYEKEENRFSDSMNFLQMIINMSEGNPGALAVLHEMTKDAQMLINIFLLDTLEIRGSKIYMLYNDCCNQDYQKFEDTLLLIKIGVFTREEIYFNLNQNRAIPFIDDNIQLDNSESYSKRISYKNQNFDEYCLKQKESFKNRIELIKENQKRMII